MSAHFSQADSCASDLKQTHRLIDYALPRLFEKSVLAAAVAGRLEETIENDNIIRVEQLLP